MLFRKKNCTQCGSSYDVVNDTCPACHARDENYDTLGIPQRVVWLPIYKQILLFVFGFIGLEILGTIFSFAFMSLSETNYPLYLMLVNGIRYVLVTIGMACLMIGNYKSMKNSFNKWWAYLIGVGGIVALVSFSLIYGNIVNWLYPTTSNANQQAVNSVVSAFPLTSILVLGILGPIVEEFTYRVGLFNFLLRTKKWIAYLVTILVFALIHFDFTAILTGVQTGDWSSLINELLNLPSYAFAGAALCVLYEKCGLSASIIAHVGNNLYSIIMYLLLLQIEKLMQ